MRLKGKIDGAERRMTRSRAVMPRSSSLKLKGGAGWQDWDGKVGLGTGVGNHGDPYYGAPQNSL